MNSIVTSQQCWDAHCVRPEAQGTVGDCKTIDRMQANHKHLINESHQLPDDDSPPSPPPSANNKETDTSVVFESKTPFLVDNDNADDDDYDPFEDDSEDEEERKKQTNFVGRVVLRLQQTAMKVVCFIDKKCQGYLFSLIILLLYMAYFIYAMCYRFGDEGSIRLLWFTVLGVIIISRHRARQLATRTRLVSWCTAPKTPSTARRLNTARFFTRWLLYGGVGAFMGYVIVDVAIKDPIKLRSVPGILVFMLICFLFSSHPSKVNWHTIYWSLGIQFILAVLMMRWQGGKDVILWIQTRLDNFFANGKPASRLVFGEKYTDHYMVFWAFPIAFLSNAVLSMLYHVGAMQLLISYIGNAMHFILDTTPVESMGVAASIFMEGTIALLSIRPYLDKMTKSELFTLTTACLSSIGGGYLAILSQIGIPVEFMLPAMVISAPATFTICKLMVPETKKPKQFSLTGELPPEMRHSSLLEAASTGALSVVSTVVTIVVSAYTFVSLLAWINSTLTWFGLRVGIQQLTLEKILSYAFYPVAYLMGVDEVDCRNVGMLMGLRISSANLVSTLKMMELVGNRHKFQQYSMQLPNATVTYMGDHIVLDQWNMTLVDGYISRRAELISTYALCGFSAVWTTMATISILGTLIPKRSSWLINMTFPLLISGNLANLMVGCFAGLLADLV